MAGLLRWLGELQTQYVPCNIGAKLFAANSASRLSLDHRAKLSRDLSLSAQNLADELRAAINRCGERGATTLEVYRALNGFVHEVGQ